MLRNRYFREKGEINSTPSVTVPDQSMTPQYILETFARGQVPDVGNAQPFYSEDFDFMIQGLDLVELDELREEIQEQIDNGNTDLQALYAEINRRQQPPETKPSSGAAAE